MKKVTTTKATYRGVEIKVMSENNGHGTTYSCTNNSGKPKMIEKWFGTQGEALADERHEIVAVLRYGVSSALPVTGVPGRSAKNWQEDC
jgi:hypothetical protein